VTPKGGVARPGTVAPRRRSPLEPEEPVAVGRRPSSPAFLLFVAIMWLAVGVVMFLSLSTGWRLIPSIVAIGIGLLFLRGAGATVVRRERRGSPDR
jgi:hypothetical protein